MPLRARQKIGKYRILSRIASGPLADVYRAYDTIQNINVALKIPKVDRHTGARGIPARSPCCDQASPSEYSVGAQCQLYRWQLCHRHGTGRRVACRSHRAPHIDGPGARLWRARGLRRWRTRTSTKSFTATSSRKTSSCLPTTSSNWPTSALRNSVCVRSRHPAPARSITLRPNRRWADRSFSRTYFRWDWCCTGCSPVSLPEWPFEWPMIGHDKLRARVRPELIDSPQEGHSA